MNRNSINTGQRLSSSARKIIKLRQRAFQSGGASIELQIPINYIRDISRKLNYDITSDASLIMTTNTIKEGALFNCVPSLSNSDFQATRATTATVIQKDRSIGDGCYNLNQFNEDFTNAIWNKFACSISANQKANPINGLIDADKIIENNTSAGHQVYQTINATSGATYANSIYIKSFANETDERRYSFLQIISGSDGLSRYTIVLDGLTGAITDIKNLNSAAPLLTNISNSVINIGGYWRLTASATANFNGILYINIGISNSATPAYISNTPTYLGNGVGFIYIWGASVIQGSIPKDYLKTTNRLAVPSIDYGLGSTKPALLVEPQRTNLLLNSAIGTTQNVTVTAQSYTLSFYGIGSYTLSGVYSGVLNGTGVNNLVSLTFTPTAGTLTFTVSGSITNVQLEAGNTTSSRIITSGATATRNAYTSFVDLQNNSLLNKDNFTLYVEGYLQANVGTNHMISLTDTTSTTSNGNQVGWFDGLRTLISISNSVTTQGANLSINNYFKLCISVNGTSVKHFRNGVQLGTTQTVPVFDYRYLQVNTGGSTYFLSRIMLWKTTKTDSDCITLTS